ncbi:MAG: YHYH protein [Chitinophagaceae bacterium]|nr:MAG: YHYH protein [Chitinophagaceae bacterium]
MKLFAFAGGAVCLLLSFACKKNEDATAGTNSNSTTGGTTIGTNVPAVYQKIYGATSITYDGTWVYIKTNGAPDHKSAYYPTGNSLYESFNGTTFAGNTFHRNPNSIATQNYTFKIPANPQVSATHAATPLGPIGVSLNGVPFFNQYAGPNQPLTNEITSFDQWWGHPAQSGDYHYHVEPKYLTTVKANRSALLGFLLDGFPVYGPEEAGVTVANSQLDAYHGHTSTTADYPGGIYHYHITSTDPYINGNGFYGSAGTVTR